MSEAQSNAETKQPTHRGRAFADMKRGEKVIWILKVIVCAVSFGMIFPGVMED